MPNALRLTLAIVAGIVAGAIVNSALVKVGPSLIPPPPGSDMTTADGLRATMPLLEPRHFLMPFLAHALGTFVGALLGVLVTRTHHDAVAYTVGIVFLCGGIAASFMIPAPTWFIAADLVLAYIPMAWLGLQVARRVSA